MHVFTISRVDIKEDGYIGPHGWYWQPSAIAGIVFRALRDQADTDLGAVYVSDLFKHEAGALAAGCHDTLYSVFVKVTSGYSLPTRDQIFDAYKNTNAQFNVETINGGYHFYKTWYRSYP